MAKLLNINNFKQAKQILKHINTSSQGIEVMHKKMFNLNILLENLNPGEANIIKQEAVTIGADAALAKGVAEGTTKKSSAVIMGNLRQIKKLSNRLEYHKNHNFTQINTNIKNLLTGYNNNFSYCLDFEHTNLKLDETKIMGILNVTPDSFSDGGNFVNVEKAVKHALQMLDDGASIIDIGGESTRPGSDEVAVNTEIERVVPVIKMLKQKAECIISIDTKKPEVALQAVKAGADIINDVSGLAKLKMIEVLKAYPQTKVVIMHMQGIPKTMQQQPKYDDVLAEVYQFFEEKLDYCTKNGIDLNRIIIDPGIGFGKRQEDNIKLISNLSYFDSLGVCVLLGASRKSFIGNIYKSEPNQRLAGSLATTAEAFKQKVQIVRVHDVKEHYQFLQVLKRFNC